MHIDRTIRSLFIALPLTAVLTTCGPATHQFIVYENKSEIRAAFASICGKNVSASFTVHKVMGRFKALCPGPLLVRVGLRSGSVECKLGYIDSTEERKTFVFTADDQKCVLNEEQTQVR
jgi:sorbitol-specific phosphotransferase system component IIC